MNRTFVLAAAALAAVAVPAVGNAAPAPATVHATASSAPTGDEWRAIVPGGDCQCADGGEFTFFDRPADPTKVVLFLEGGGACWDGATCDYRAADAVFDHDVGADDHPSLMDGIFDLDNPANPFADYSMVYVPYCTGDVHLGTNTQEYSPELTIEHKGAINGQAAVAYLAEQYPDAIEVVVVGESAGAVAAPLYGGLVADALPDARVTVFADGSGGYPDIPGVNTLIGTAWGTLGSAPDWDVNEGLTVEEYSIPSLWIRSGTEHPDITMGRFDFDADEAQVFYSELAGFGAEGLAELMAENEATIEAAGVEQWSYTAPGDRHTLVRQDDFYTMDVDGVTLRDWVAALIAGNPLGDVG